jgi:nitroimidazol reductase NimA-like FMN-containing flavoprotein (pyridoxamine 5'-phosphate oxidase superfamily)
MPLKSQRKVPGARSRTRPSGKSSPSAAARRRLDHESNLWLSTVGKNQQPHLVPVWFVTVGGALYLCTDPRSVKVANVRRRPRVAASLEGGDHPVIVRGEAKMVAAPWPLEVVRRFRRKYDWDITSDGTYSCLVEIRPSRWIEW